MARPGTPLAGMLLGSLLVAGGAQAVRDHLQCYAARDPLRLRGVVSLSSALGVEPGCKLGRARFFCDPAASSVLAANVPLQRISGRGLLDGRVCYPVKCPRPFPPGQVLSDQFGGHALDKLRPRFLCTPAVRGPPAPLMDNLDHLACYAASDTLKLKGRVGVDTLHLGEHIGCRIARGALLCVPASAIVEHINVGGELSMVGTGADDARVCYPVTCPRPRLGPQVASDRFGSRTLTGLSPRLLCAPAPPPSTTTTTVTTTTVTTTTFVSSDPALMCQRAIERGGMTYAREVLDQIEACTRPGGSTSLEACMRGAAVVAALEPRRSAWGADTAVDCRGVNLRSDLGYHEICGAAPSACTFPSDVRDAPGASNDLLDCLACRLNEQLVTSARALYGDQDVTEACRQAIGDGALAVLRSALEGVNTCAQEPTVTSLAACFTPDFSTWRTQAKTACAGVDPFLTLGYSNFCSGVPAVAPNSYALHALPCSINMSVLDHEATDNDLLDCAACQAGEGVLGVGRDLFGANLCCVGGKCDKVLARFACRRDGGYPARYRISSLAATDAGYAHGIDVGPDGSLYLGDRSRGAVTRVSPDGDVSTVGGTAFGSRGVAVDGAGNVYVTNGCQHTITKIAPGGASAVIAGTGVAGHSGDGGLARDAQIVMPDGIAADAAGNVYFTESGLLGFLCGTFLSSERVRMIDTKGMIHTVAGGSGLGGAGEGGPATLAQLFLPYGLRRAFDGSLLVGEAGGERVLRVAGGTLTRVAGVLTSPVGSHSGYGGPARNARFYENCGVAQDPDGNVLISPMEDNRVALVDTLGSVIAIAGTGDGRGFGGPPVGDGGPGVLAQVDTPEDVVVAPNGTIYVSELATNKIRVLTREPF